jgi:hypothetical protein
MSIDLNCDPPPPDRFFTYTFQNKGTKHGVLTLQTHLLKLQIFKTPISQGINGNLVLFTKEWQTSCDVKISGLDAKGYSQFMKKAAQLQPQHIDAADAQLQHGMTLHEIEAVFDNVLSEIKYSA